MAFAAAGTAGRAVAGGAAKKAATSAAASTAESAAAGAGAAASAPAAAPAAQPSSTSAEASKPSPGGGAAKNFKAAATDQRGTPGWFRDAAKVSSPAYALNAGGGALLGTLAWVIGLTYLRDGKPGVQRWFKAKFFNQVSS